MLISILVPVFNEERTIKKILEKISKLEFWLEDQGLKKEIIIIDDGSFDDTKKILEENKSLYSKLILNKKNYGKGFSIKKGLEIAKGDYILIQDADDEYDPSDYIKFIECAKKFKADLVVGSRFVYDKYTRSHNFFNKVGNNFITLIFNLLYNTTFTDIYSCYIFFKRELINPIKLKTLGFDQHAEILCKLIKNGSKFYEVPINYNGRTIKEGKKIRFYHIFSIIFQMLKNRFV